MEEVQHIRIVKKGGTSHLFFKLDLDFDDVGVEMSGVQFKMSVREALKQLHGEVGKAMLVDVLHFDEGKMQAIIRVHHDDGVKFWSAVTLYSNYHGNPCAYRVLQVSGHLMGLAVDTRRLVYK